MKVTYHHEIEILNAKKRLPVATLPKSAKLAVA